MIQKGVQNCIEFAETMRNWGLCVFKEQYYISNLKPCTTPEERLIFRQQDQYIAWYSKVLLSVSDPYLESSGISNTLEYPCNALDPDP